MQMQQQRQEQMQQQRQEQMQEQMEQPLCLWQMLGQAGPLAAASQPFAAGECWLEG
jgi:hypothetical protein